MIKITYPFFDSKINRINCLDYLGIFSFLQESEKTLYSSVIHVRLTKTTYSFYVEID